MSLDTLADEITKQARAEAEAIIHNAKAEAKRIEDEAKSEADLTSLNASSKAEKESQQISVEVVASARQANQKRALIARREELEATWHTAKEEVGSTNMEGRKKILDSLVKEASGMKKDMIMRPVKIDRGTLSKSEFKLGEDIDGLGQIQSSRIADAQIEFTGRGALSTATKRGWLSSLLAIIWPF